MFSKKLSFYLIVHYLIVAMRPALPFNNISFGPVGHDEEIINFFKY